MDHVFISLNHVVIKQIHSEWVSLGFGVLFFLLETGKKMPETSKKNVANCGHMTGML